ncbi:uncharacterized protein [Diabrotica undecimpunctata]|uniref:uncharacterized protein n=1 Tax=Diabrotica undecimpunctata TaxID=50387 RepID=UPI003B6420DF
MAEDEEYLLENNFLLLLMLENSRVWVNDIYRNREENGEFHLIWNDLLRQPQKFFEYFRMLPETFNYILFHISERLEKQSNFRKCIQPAEKLALTLRCSDGVKISEKESSAVMRLRSDAKSNRCREERRNALSNGC